jgi:hypothetical protein
MMARAWWSTRFDEFNCAAVGEAGGGGAGRAGAAAPTRDRERRREERKREERKSRAAVIIALFSAAWVVAAKNKRLFSVAVSGKPSKIRLFSAAVSVAAENNLIFGGLVMPPETLTYFRRPSIGRRK